MPLRFFQVDAFTDHPFAGNPAAVCLLEAKAPADKLPISVHRYRIVKKLGEVIRLLKTRGYTIILVEQNFRFAAPLADRHYVLEHGHIVMTVQKDELASKTDALHELLGV